MKISFFSFLLFLLHQTIIRVSLPLSLSHTHTHTKIVKKTNEKPNQTNNKKKKKTNQTTVNGLEVVVGGTESRDGWGEGVGREGGGKRGIAVTEIGSARSLTQRKPEVTVEDTTPLNGGRRQGRLSVLLSPCLSPTAGSFSMEVPSLRQ